MKASVNFVFSTLLCSGVMLLDLQKNKHFGFHSITYVPFSSFQMISVFHYFIIVQMKNQALLKIVFSNDIVVSSLGNIVMSGKVSHVLSSKSGKWSVA